MERFIDPKTLARVKDIELVAKTVAEGFLYGLQPSMQRGVGIEFSQYRSYQNGDDLNRIDWKLFARSDRYFVREAERESEIDVWLLLDASRSMLQKSEVSESELSASNQTSTTWNKLEYAKYLLASIGYLAQKQGDSIGYLGMSSDELNFLPSGNGEHQWKKLLQVLTSTKCGHYFPKADLLKYHISQLQKKSLVFIVSDFNQQQQEITEFISKLNTSQCEVVTIQLICDDEINFNYKGAIRFKDLETHEEVLVSANEARVTYHKNYNHYQQQLEKNLTQHNTSYQRFNIDKPLDEILSEYLHQRNRIR